MLEDCKFTKGEYHIFFDKQNPKTFIAINKSLYTIRREKIANFRKIGMINFSGKNSEIYPFELKYSELTEKKIIWPLRQVAIEFEKNNENNLRKY